MSSISRSSLEGSFTLESGGNRLLDDAPFHILCLGNWSGSGENADLSARRPIEIDRDNFDDVLRKIRPSVKLDFDGENSINLVFTELDDFHPDNLFRRVPLFENLRDIRQRLKNHDTFNQAAGEVRSWFAPTEAVTEEKVEPIESDNLLDAILSGKSVDATAVKPKATELSRFVSNIVEPHIIRTDLNEQAELLAAVDQVISDLMRKILHHKDFMAIEAAWRGLYFLVIRTDTDSDLKIFLFDISKQELLNDLKSGSDLADSVYAKWTAGDKLETTIGEPWAVVLGDYDFAPNVDDIAGLMRISQIGAASNTPFVSHIRPDVLGVKSLTDNPDSSSWHLSVESNEWKLWEALRTTTESEYLGMAMPRFLARLPYGRATDPTEVFVFEEFTGNQNEYIWANPAIACGYLLAKSYRKNAWEMAENIAREIDHLPIHVYQIDGETITKPCAEILMTETSVQKMVDAGVIPLVSFRDSDRVRVASFQSIANSGERIRGRWS